MRDGQLAVVACDDLLRELGDVLRRQRFRRYLSLEEVNEYVSEIGALCRMVEDPHPIPEVLRDPDDDYLIALAAQSGVGTIVSGDLDLREATGLAVEVLTPREALGLIARHED